MIGRKLASRYEILREVGRGGMGVVYLARDPVLDRDVAIKMLTSGNLQGDQRERFEREARAVAKLDHPGIVPVYDFADFEGNLFFVMPYVEGMTLRAVQKDEALKPADVLDIGAQVADALHYSHQRGIVHRDIKPENVMVTREGGEWRAKLMDFGIALGPKDSRMTKSDIIVGTLAYLPPESILDSSTSPAADIYSLGVVLFESLSGKLPFSGDTQTVLYKIVHSDPEPPGLLASLVDLETENIILSCMAKAPSARPKDGTELASVLRELSRRLRNPESALSPAIAVPKTGNALVGRTHEIEDLVKSFHRAQAGEAQLALIGGEQGLGKASLLREVERMAKSRGAVVLHGRFVEKVDPALPYQGFGEAFREYIDTDRERATRAIADLLPELRALFPEIAESAGGGPSGGAAKREDRTFTLDLLARTIGRLAADQTLVLLFEDLHLADASLEAIQYVFHRRASSRLMIAGTYVQASEGDALSRLVRGIRGDQGTIVLQLKALTATDCQQIAVSILGRDRVTDDAGLALLQATGGNPLFVTELVRSLSPEGRFEEFARGAAGGTGLALPNSIQKLMQDKVAALADADRSVLQAAAIIGTSFDPVEVAHLSGLGSQAEAAIEGLVERGVLRDDAASSGTRLAFASTLLLDATYRTLNQVRRRALHRQYAEFLETRYTKRLDRVAPILFRHYSTAGLPDKAAPHGLAAASNAFAGGAYEESRRLAQAVLALVEGGDWLGDPTFEAAASHLCGRAALESSDFEGAVRLGRRAASLFAHARDHSGQTEALALASEAALRGLKLDEAKAIANEGLELARVNRLTETARRFSAVLDAVQRSRSQGASRESMATAFTSETPAESLRAPAPPRASALLLLEAEYLAAEEAAEERSRRGTPATPEEEVAHLMRLADLALRVGRLRPGLAACRQAMSMAAAGDVLTHASLGLLYARFLLRMLQPAEALEAARTALAPNYILKGCVPRALVVPLVAVEARALVLLGEASTAREKLEAEGVHAETGHDDKALTLILAYAEVLIHLGDRAAALALVDEVLSAARERGDTAAQFEGLSARANILLVNGSPDAALVEARQALALANEVPDALLLTANRLIVGRCLVEVGAASAADAEFLAANREAESMGARALLLEAQLGLSATSRARGQYLSAEIAARVALQFAATASANLLRARAEFELALAFVRSGALAEAGAALESARAIAGEVGDVAVHIDALTELARLARLAGESARARDLALEAWTESTERGDSVRRGAVMLELGRLEIDSGQTEAAETRFRGALTAAFASRAPRLATRLYDGLVDARLKAGDVPGALRYAETAEVQAATLGEFGASEAIASALLTARVHRAALNVAALREDIARVGRISDDCGDRLLQARGALESGRVCIEADPELALSVLERGLLRARESDAVAVEAAIAGSIAAIQIRRGFIEEAKRYSEEEMQAIGRAGIVAGAMRNKLRLSRCLGLLGDLKASADLLEAETPPPTEPSMGVSLLSYRSQIRVAQGRMRDALEDADAAVRLASSGTRRDLVDSLLHRASCALAAADAPAAATDLASAKRASESLRGVHRPFEDGLLGYAQTQLLLLKGDFAAAAVAAELACLTFERGSHEVWAAFARLLAVRCLFHSDRDLAKRLTERSYDFARERAVLSMQTDALVLRALLATDPAPLAEADALASRIGSAWVLASVARVRHAILTSRHDAAAATAHRALLAHVSAATVEMDAAGRARVLAAVERAEHPLVI